MSTNTLTPAQVNYVATELERQFPHLSITVTNDGATLYIDASNRD